MTEQIPFNADPAIILVNPQLGENIGMVARAMLNCGLKDLRLVNPRDGWPSESAVRAASGALEKGHDGVTAVVYESTAAAMADCHFTLATTARPRDMVKNVYTAQGGAEEAYRRQFKGQKTGILFGAERAGLQNEDIALASAVITIPLNPDFSSLNLAQAVLLVAHNFFVLRDQTPDHTLSTGKTEVATSETITGLSDRLIDALDQVGFFRSPDLRPTMERNLISMIARQQWTDQDINTLHGVISAFVGKRKQQ